MLEPTRQVLVTKAITDQLEIEIDNLNLRLVDDDGARLMELVLMIDHLSRVKDYFEKGLECNE